MDGSRFDALARSFTEPGSRRRALSGLLAGTFSLLGSQTEAVAAKKKKPCPPCKKRKKGKCKGTLPEGTPCPGGACQGGSCIDSAPSTPCVPESQAVTCAGAACGTARNNNCGQAVACNCPRGQECLLNGTCARPCTSFDCSTCGAGTGACSNASTEGVRHCVASEAGSACLVQACSSTRDCPQGTHCQHCGAEATWCIPLSPCTGTCNGADACLGGTGTCPGGGRCWQPLDGGPTRCGVVAPASCGCDSDWRCEQDHGTGSFCATFVPGGACICGDEKTTFCITPP